MIRLTIEGIQKAQAANLKLIAALTPQSAAGKATKEMTIGAHQYYVKITHVDTGSLRAARMMSLNFDALRGSIFTDPKAVNPDSKQKPAIYDIYEQARGGSHAAGYRTVREAGPKIQRLGARILMQEFSRA